MHQDVAPDFNKLAPILVDAESKTGAPIRGVGKRSSIRVVMKNEPVAIEFYAETVVTPEPGNPALGFTAEDLNIFLGVAIYAIQDPREDGKRRSYGEAMPVERFLERYISDERARIIIRGCMSRLEEEATVQQGFLDRLNNIWQDRDVNRRELYSKRLH